MGDLNLDRLKCLREQHGYSQKYVAISVGVAPSIVSRWESGLKTPSRESIIRLAELYGISVDYLLDRSDNESRLSLDSLSLIEKQLLSDYRSLNKQGKEYILQTMAMAVTIYKNDLVSDVEKQA